MSVVHLIKKIPVIGNLLRKSKKTLFRFIPRSAILKLYDRTDWKKVDQEVAEFYNTKYAGVNAAEAATKQKTIVSLTSYPPRIPRIHYTIISLLKQTFKPNAVVLYLGSEKFPNREADLPETLLKLREHGLTIHWTKDIRSYTKLIPALREYPDDVITTADDDVLYHREWLEQLYVSYQKNNNCIHCHRAHRIRFTKNNELLPYNQWEYNIDFQKTEVSFTNFLTGVGGVLYPPKIFYKDIADDGLFQKLSPLADDIWFWAMAVLQGTPIQVVVNNTAEPKMNHPLSCEEILGETGLMAENVAGGKNDIQLRNMLEAYPLLKERLRITTGSASAG